MGEEARVRLARLVVPGQDTPFFKPLGYQGVLRELAKDRTLSSERTLAQAAVPSIGCGTDPRCRRYAPEMAHYIFNFVKSDAATGLPARDQAASFMRLGMWGVSDDERYRNALAPGNLVLIYLGAPEREFIGHAELASAARDWTPPETEAYPGNCSSGVLLAHVNEWDPSVPMSAVLPRIDSPQAKADFEAGLVLISANEYEIALAVAAERANSSPGGGDPLPVAPGSER